jgi:bifunctional DNA-binding transcriptional regulator/antitoxin component of YhaV-PrlF toxin-antitoxin module
MTATTFRLPIGNKCQVTIPKPAMGLLSLAVGDDLLLEVKDDHAVLHPMLSVPRRELPEELRKKFESRRGSKPTDIPLKTLLKEIGYRPKAGGRNPHTARHAKPSGSARSRIRTASEVPPASSAADL